MPFELSSNLNIERDAQGVVRQLEHAEQPFTSAAMPEGLAAAAAPRVVATEYLHEVAPLYGIDAALLQGIDAAPAVDLANEDARFSLENAREPVDEGPRLRLAEEKPIFETTVVGYDHTILGLPIWESGVSVTVQDTTTELSPGPRVTSSQSSLHQNVQLGPHDFASPYVPANLTRTRLAESLGLPAASPAAAAGGAAAAGAAPAYGEPRINAMRLLVYLYAPEERTPSTPGDIGDAMCFQTDTPTVPLPPVPETVTPGLHYVVNEVLFTLPVAGWGDVNWRAFVETVTGAVLYERPFIACATGHVFPFDPLTTTGISTITPSSPAATLDPLRRSVTLAGLGPPNAGAQALTGQFVALVNRSAPPIPSPTTTTPFDFMYSAVTNDFAAVNAYHHSDFVFRLVEGMGFNMATFFDGTTFPVPVDHRATIGTNCSNGVCVNAQAPGNSLGRGSDGFRYALAGNGSAVGIAADLRIVLHEFGHALLWDCVHSPNFGFAHSAGDSLAAVLCDPGSRAPNRFLTFPWVLPNRRHDRPVSGGWGWGGVNDTGMGNAGYLSEQILATTMFRLYRAIGGDAVQADGVTEDLPARQFAARYVAYLLIRAMGSLASNPVTATRNVGVFTTALMNADTGTSVFEGHPGGAFAKVVRWSFEKQGLFQPPGAPTPVTSVGSPPAVDVFIDDGRQGEYDYRQNVETTEIWNRHNADGGTVHEPPTAGVTNHLFVRIRNRGTQLASDVDVRAFTADATLAQQWPGPFQPTAVAQLGVAAGVPSGAAAVAGPFAWTPLTAGPTAVFIYVSATGDLSNADPASLRRSAQGPIALAHLVRGDNNIGLRTMQVI